MRTLKLTVSYDGTNYVGWQRQINGVSVQQIVEEAFVPLVGAPPTVSGASRTDAGVHALGQVASVNIEIDLPAPAIQRALNIRLPADIRVIAVVDAPLGFHARFRARGKAYRYRIITTSVLSPFDRAYAWHVPQPLAIEAMQRASAAIAGTHDFAVFQARGSSIANTERTLDRVDVSESGGEIRLDVEGDGFLRHMVRTIAGTIVEVGAGQRAPEDLPSIIASGDRQRVGRTAPAHGLTLISVRY